MQSLEAQEIQSVILAQDMLDGLAELREHINDATLTDCEIDPRDLFCQKTGHVVGKRDENSLFLLTKLYGKNAIVSHLYYSVSLNIHPAWLFTDGDSLDVLIDADPIGYACYCFNLITEQFYQNTRNQDRKRLPAIERHWALARANAIMISRGIGELTELNIELCKFLTYAPDTKTHLFRMLKEYAKSADQLAQLAVTGELTGKLREATGKTLAGIGQASYAISGRDIFDHRNRLKKNGLIDEIYRTPADAAKGPSNIRKQRASKRDVKEAGLFSELSKLFDIEEIARPKTENDLLRRNLQKRAQQNEAIDPFMFDLSALDNLNLDQFDMPGEAGENEVEVRSLAPQPNGLAPVHNIIDQNNQVIVVGNDAVKFDNGEEISIGAEMAKIAEQLQPQPVQIKLAPENQQMTARERLAAALKKGK